MVEILPRRLPKAFFKATVQDRLDGARLQLLQLRQEYAVGVAQILFDAGELVGREAESYRVNSVLLDRAGFAGIR